MGGYRARGALATLALATVVLVAVVVAGTVSMAPLGDNWTGDIAGPEDRDSFDIVGGVIIPGSPSEPGTGPGVNDPDPGEPDPGEPDPGDVDVVLGPEPADPGAAPQDPIPPGPIVDPGDPGDPPGEPQPPVVDPTEPPVVDPTEPPVVPPTEPPVVDPTEPPVVAPRPPDQRPTAGGPSGPAKHDEPGLRHGKRGKPPIVIVHGPRGPRWRPSEPARQRHPHDADKWSRAQPHPRQRGAVSPSRPEPRQGPVAHAPAKPRAVVPSRPSVGGGDDRGRSHGSVSRAPDRKNHGHGGGKGHGRRGHGTGKRARR